MVWIEKKRETEIEQNEEHYVIDKMYFDATLSLCCYSPRNPLNYDYSK